MSSSNLSVTQVLEREKYLNDKVDNVNVNFEMIFLHLASVLRNIKRMKHSLWLSLIAQVFKLKKIASQRPFVFMQTKKLPVGVTSWSWKCLLFDNGPGIQKSFTELSAAVLKSTTYSQAKVCGIKRDFSFQFFGTGSFYGVVIGNVFDPPVRPNSRICLGCHSQIWGNCFQD